MFQVQTNFLALCRGRTRHPGLNEGMRAEMDDLDASKQRADLSYIFASKHRDQSETSVLGVPTSLKYTSVFFRSLHQPHTDRSSAPKARIAGQ